MNHNISISSCFDYNIPFEKQMKYIAEAGFTHVSIGSDLGHSKLFDEGQAEKIKNALFENNLSIDTIHFSQSLVVKDCQLLIKKTLQIADKLSCPVVVAHCTSFMGNEIQSEEDIEKLMTTVISLEDLCKKYNVKIALENLCPGKATDILEQMLESTNPDCIGFCYDSSHDQVDGPRPMTLLKKWKDRLMAVHISDRIAPFIDHVIIGEGFIDFNEMSEILRTIDFDFPFLMEVSKTHSQYKDTKKFLEKTYLNAYDVFSKIKQF